MSHTSFRNLPLPFPLPQPSFITERYIITMSSITSFFSSFLPTIQADAAAEEKPADENNAQVDSETSDSEEAPAEVEEEEEEAEDSHPAIREECQNSAKCAPLAKHFEHCQEKVQAGEGFKGEDCVEEMFHMMHCAEGCAAPKLFAKLR
ncbi:Non-heme 11 kDa protein of cytochrome bc1 complex [Lentinula aciculospora]|uniref:Non-heme 11 kDa protein of cytochrome bc1 complex n=1 Tax=Lentinula aciculospora TaxID=153920 RepID=A0A9W9AVU9_9AGAR|nr:Non-heme 11 kDa protein of cytochrome bc1 complex [Lentinula aciculospora]